MARRPAFAFAICLGLACDSAEERRAEEAYAARAIEILSRVERTNAIVSAECDAGLTPCAAAAQEAADITRRGASDLVGLSPPRKLAGAHRKLVRGLDHVALAYDALADTYWNRAGAYEAFVRSTKELQESMAVLTSGAIEIGFKGDPKVWRALDPAAPARR